MATRNDEAGGSRLWRGMRHLIFGEDSEPTLREEIEDAIDEAEDSRPVAEDQMPHSAPQPRPAGLIIARGHQAVTS